MTIVYGVDTDKPVTPLMVRGAIEECFFHAHCQDAGLGSMDTPEMSREYCKQLIRKGFEETHGDYDHPTKESLMAVVGYLVNFSKAFRDPKIIEAHKNEIFQLLNAIP